MVIVELSCPVLSLMILGIVCVCVCGGGGGGGSKEKIAEHAVEDVWWLGRCLPCF